MKDLFSNPEVFTLLIQICVGGIASFIAIISWSYTRHSSWFFVILGTLGFYAAVLYKSMRLFGLLSKTDFMVLGSPLGSLISESLPIVFFLIAGIFYIKENK